MSDAIVKRIDDVARRMRANAALQAAVPAAIRGLWFGLIAALALLYFCPGLWRFARLAVAVVLPMMAALRVYRTALPHEAAAASIDRVSRCSTDTRSRRFIGCMIVTSDSVAGSGFSKWSAERRDRFGRTRDASTSEYTRPPTRSPLSIASQQKTAAAWAAITDLKAVWLPKYILWV